MQTSNIYYLTMYFDTPGTRDFQCGLSGLGQVFLVTRAKIIFLVASPLVTSAFGRRSVPLRPTPKHKAVRKMKTSSTQGSILRRSGLERVYIPSIYIAFVPLGS